MKKMNLIASMLCAGILATATSAFAEDTAAPVAPPAQVGQVQQDKSEVKADKAKLKADRKKLRADRKAAHLLHKNKKRKDKKTS